MRTKTMAAIGLSVVIAVGVAASAAASRQNQNPGGGSGSDVRSANFHNPTPNPYFPMRPGTVWRYRGTDEGEHFREVVRVTHTKKSILGIRATVVRDVLRRVDGSLAEKTHDWYAADHDGNVWYLGENTATYDESGHLESREGSWRAGVDGAVAGIVMPADPRPTDAYRQEFYRGQAEDQAWLVQRGFATKVPYGTVKRSLRSFEWSRLEQRVISMKVYGPRLGIVIERDVSGGSEVFRLVSVHHHR